MNKNRPVLPMASVPRGQGIELGNARTQTTNPEFREHGTTLREAGWVKPLRPDDWDEDDK